MEYMWAFFGFKTKIPTHATSRLPSTCSVSMMQLVRLKNIYIILHNGHSTYENLNPKMWIFHFQCEGYVLTNYK